MQCNLFQFCTSLICLLQLVFKNGGFCADDEQLPVFIFNLDEIISHWVFELEWWTGTANMSRCSYVAELIKLAVIFR